MKEVKEKLLRDRFAVLSGIRLVELEKGRAVAELDVEDRHMNGVDIVQGGVYFTLADFAFAAAVNSHGRVAVAVKCDITFFKAVKEGRLRAVAEEVSLGKRIAHYRVNIYSGAEKPVAVFSGTAFRTEEVIGKTAE